MRNKMIIGKFLLAVLVSATLLADCVSAQGKLYVLVVADTANVADPKSSIGSSCLADLNSIRNTLQKLAGTQPPPYEIQSVDGDKFTPDNLRRALADLTRKAGPQDAIYFHYSGHGSSANGAYFLELKGGTVPRSEVVAAVKSSNARLQLIVSDACAVVRDSDYNKNVREARSYDSQKATISPLYRRLFLECSGVVDVVSASEGELADSYGNQEKGGIFTWQLLETLATNASNDQLTWQQVIETATKSTSEEFTKNHGEGLRRPSDSQIQYVQSPRSLQLAVQYRKPEPTVVVVNSPTKIDPSTGSLYLERQTLRDGVVVDSVRVNQDLTAYKFPGSDGTWLWRHQGLTVVASDQSAPANYWFSERLGTGFFAPPDGFIFVVNSLEGTPGNNLRMSDGRRWLLEYGESIREFNGRQINSLSDLQNQVNSAGSQFSLVVWDGAAAGKLSGAFESGGGAIIDGMGGGVGGGLAGMTRLGIEMGNGPDGAAIVVAVSSGSAAENLLNNAGEVIRLEVGDEIYSINGQQVSSAEHASRLIQSASGRTSLQVRDINTGSLLTLTANLPGGGNPGGGNPGGSGRVPLGVSLVTTNQGVMIQSVTPGSPATRCVVRSTGQTGIELEAGDFILAVNGTSVSDQQTAVRLINQTNGSLELLVEDHKSGQTYQLQTALRNR
ncbi:MAG: PDZ domain-containing protein [Pirellulaceae bacterium]|nr:PDZ domain-containing protein [Pirellulaceae bacterium]